MRPPLPACSVTVRTVDGAHHELTAWLVGPGRYEAVSPVPLDDVDGLAVRDPEVVDVHVALLPPGGRRRRWSIL